MIKVILADNQAIFRAGASKVLAVEDDIRVVVQAENAEKMNAALEKFQAALLIFAAAIQPDVAAVVRAAARFKTRVVVIAEPTDTPQTFLAAGVNGVIFRNVSGPALVQCARAAAQGERYVQPKEDATGTAKPEDEYDAVGARVRDRLTAKELKIVSLIVQGYKNKEIATRLGTTEQVIKNYLRNVYDKIGVSDRLELALFTIHHKILAEAAAAATASAGPPASQAIQ